MNKKKIFFISLLGSIIFFISVFVPIEVPIKVCYQGGFCGNVSEVLTIYFLLFVPMFIFSIITFKLKELTFILWRNFSIWAIPISLIVISFLPTNTHGLDFIPVTKGTVIFLLTILYSIISLALVIYKSLQNNNSN